MRAFVGIDPGMLGAIGWIVGDTYYVEDAPSVPVAKGRDYLTGKMAEIVWRIRDDVDGGSIFAVVEQTIAMPRQSSSTTAKAARGCGLWEGLLAGNGIGYELVQARKWKVEFGLDSDKNKSRVLAQRLFPSIAAMFERVKDDGRAEAMLIAEYARRRYGGAL